MLSCYFVVCFADLGKNNFKLMRIRQSHVARLASNFLIYLRMTSSSCLHLPSATPLRKEDKYRSNL